MTKIANAFNIRTRYLRSAHIERDFYDPAALEGYIVTRDIQRCLDRITDGLDSRSGQRAWRVTGDYGSGKSSFALLLSHLFSGREADLPAQIRKTVELSRLRRSRPNLLPVLITGSRESLGKVILRSLKRAIENGLDRRVKLKQLEALGLMLGSTRAEPLDSEVIETLEKVNQELISKGCSSGLLIIIDELGKFLEFSALHPERQDIYVLQQLAELSSRSGREPIFTIGLLHQGFSAYADNLSQPSQREWEKVAGRFEELLFDQPLDQITHLVGHALDLKHNSIPRGWESRSKLAMRQTIDLGWYGSAPPITSLTEVAQTIYPLHPTVVPVLVRLFSRFGQNERSLFSFLLSNEAHGLQSFALNELSVQNTFRLHHLYDYAATNFGHKLGFQSYRNHWNHIDSLVRSFPPNKELELAVLKTIGLLNLLNSPEMVSTEDAIIACLSDSTYEAQDQIRSAIEHLYREKNVLHFRGKKAGYCIWSHTSVNLQSAYEDAVKVVGTQRKVTDLIKSRLDPRPIVARRHYIQTGNLRYFEVVYCTSSELKKEIARQIGSADGCIIIPLCETAEDVVQSKSIVETEPTQPNILIGITEPLGVLAGLIQEVERWAVVEQTTPELKDDRYAFEEVSRQLSGATQALEKRVQHYVGLREAAQSGAQMPIEWYLAGRPHEVCSVAAFLSLLSDICDDVYKAAPRVSNELINRRSLSSAAAAARMRLIDRMIEFSKEEYLGMDATKKPPEMSMYLSVLKETNLHRKNQGKWSIGLPSAGEDPGNLLPALKRIKEILEQEPDGRFSVDAIFAELRKPPFGVRNGLLPLLLLVVILENHQQIAVFENGTFKSSLSSPDMLRLTKDNRAFELQYCKVQGVRLDIFEKLAEVLNLDSVAIPRTQVLDIVRPLCVFAAELPPYSRATRKLSKRALMIREAILEARDPAKLLFHSLPEACDHAAFLAEGREGSHPKRTKAFVGELQKGLEELKFALPALHNRMCQMITESFDLHAEGLGTFQAARDLLSERSENLLVHISDLDLKAFCLRFLDNSMLQSDWLESLGSFVAAVPPSRWKDEDEIAFSEKLRALALKLRRVESVNFVPKKKAASSASFRISITQRDGIEKDQVVYLSPHEEEAAKVLEEHLKSFLGNNNRVALSALSRLAWDFLGNHNE